MATKTLTAITLAAALAAAPAMAQQRDQSPSNPWTYHTGPNGWNGNTYQAPGSPFSNTTMQGPNGQQQHCTTYQAPGSPITSTNCW